MKKTLLSTLSALSLMAFLTSCNDAQVASENLSIASDNFEISRRIVFFNGITDKYLMSVEGLILASNVCASRGFTGEFEGIIGDGGDCSHIDLSGLIEFKLNAGQVYAGNVTALHESIPVEADAYRQLVRLNVPGWSV